MHAVADDHKQNILRQVDDIINERHSTHQAEQVIAFSHRYYDRVPAEDLDESTPEELATIVINLLEFARQRPPGELKIRIYNPDTEAHGWTTQHTVIEMVNDDMPFLVDSVNVALAENDQTSHLLIHPVVRVERDEGGHLLDLHQRGETEAGQDESFIHLQVNRETDPEALKRLEQVICRSMEDVREAVADWKQMRQACLDMAEALPQASPRADQAMLDEEQALLRWLADDHFTFLGYREYKIAPAQDGDRLEIVDGSGLGILREKPDTVRSRSADKLKGEREAVENDYDPLIITKTNARSTIHRVGYMDYISILAFDGKGQVTGEKRLIGLFTSNAYNRSVGDIPLIRDKARVVLERSGLREGSHAWKSLVHILETLPRDELFQAHTNVLLDLAVGVLNLQERQRTRLFVRRDRFGRFFSSLVYIPRDRFNTENREKIQAILKDAFNGETLDYVVQVSESMLARLLVIVRPKAGEAPDFDEDTIERQIIEATRSWHDDLQSILVDRIGEEQGLVAFNRFGRAFPAAYVEDVSPWVASFDVENAANLETVDDLRMSLYRPRSGELGLLRFKLFKYDKPIPLSDVLPTLENMGLRIVSERPYQLDEVGDNGSLWVQDFDMQTDERLDLDIDAVSETFQQAFEAIYRGRTESDGFNRLILLSHLEWRQVVIIRAYCKYLLQTGIPFSQTYMEDTLAAHPIITRLLVELFESLFDPDRQPRDSKERSSSTEALARVFERMMTSTPDMDEVLSEFLDEVVKTRDKPRDHQVRILQRAIMRALETVSSLDEDRILRAYTDSMLATLRTNFYCTDTHGEPSEYVSFKFDSSRVPDLPKPRPFREIWVFSPRVEGVHLRGGMVARGGLRWSDRREDFRTEVLGLMKAQNVKNTMIVPVGAKGGFFVKRLPVGDRDKVMTEVVDCYRMFINGLLDITDNLIEDEVVPPSQVIRRDEDDSYLVVAADKGTATFSDIANSVAADHEFWLGDAFASGGSAGYDHKGMGITAKGAWESVKRHFREMGVDTQTEEFTVVGIGDMAGDVFGNGMLLSEHIRLKAAFNHMHIFLDPEPDAAKSFGERKRLFDMGRSSWADYDESLISDGGGVFPRSAKSIQLSEPVRNWLGLEKTELSPNDLINELLKSEVDLLWNGGIGTYVKAASESHADVGDLANNPLRVDGQELRCKVVGEGGNLGCTQLGRIEYAQQGGRINTDFIDNSAGVDTSDHEVNIKILLNLAQKDGKLDEEARNTLLASMTDEVEDLVLRSNYLQTQAISMMETLTGPRLGAKAHFISVLEQEGILDRDLEYLPDEEEITERKNKGQGLTRPELSTLLSYSKITLYQQLLNSRIPEDEYLARELVSYFPTPLHDEYRGYMDEHRLRREIVATMVTNSMVNRMGASFALRMQEDTGASPAQVAKAYTIAREVFGARAYWHDIEALDTRVPADLQIRALLEMWYLLRQATRWLLGNPRRRYKIQTQVDRFGPGMEELIGALPQLVTSEDRERWQARWEPYEDAGFPTDLAERIASIPLLQSSLDIVDESIQRKVDVTTLAEIYYRLGEKMGLKWLGRQIEKLKVDGQWHANARGALRDELYAQHRALTGRVLAGETQEGADPVEVWCSRNQSEIRRAREMLNDMSDLPKMDYATASVALKGLEQLVQASD